MRATALVPAAAALLLANARLVDRETAPARAAGGRIVEDLHLVEDGPQDGEAAVLIHGFAGSTRWFDRLAPLLACDRRVVRVDLLGHGGSAKPAEGYALPEQARRLGRALDRLRVRRALLVGHSLGGATSIALAEERPDLVERLVLFAEGPDDSFGTTPLTTRLPFVPVLGQLLHRITPDALVRDGFRDAFADGFDLARGFDDPDQVVHDYRCMTYTASRSTWQAEQAYLAERRLDERLRRLDRPALVVFGEQDRYFRPRESAEAFRAVPGTRADVLAGCGHSPNVERPEALAALIEAFAPARSGAAR